MFWARPENGQGSVTDPKLRSGSFNIQNEFVPGVTLSTQLALLINKIIHRVGLLTYSVQRGPNEFHLTLPQGKIIDY